MSSASPLLHPLSPAHLRSCLLPREHGAWGILLISLLTGSWAGHPAGEKIVPLVLFALAALGLFCARTPLEAWLGVSPVRAHHTAERAAILFSLFLYSSISAAALVILFWRVRAFGLLPLGAAAASVFLAQSILRSGGRETRMMAQLAGSLALTSTAAGAYYLASGRFGATALAIWAANWLMAVNQIHYVQVRIRSARAATRGDKLARGRSFLLGETLTLLLLTFAWRFSWLPALTLCAFVPLLLRGLGWFFQPPRTLEIHRLGVSELLFGLLFGCLFILGFQIPGG
jgi:YwiC-like protein